MPLEPSPAAAAPETASAASFPPFASRDTGADEGAASRSAGGELLALLMPLVSEIWRPEKSKPAAAPAAPSAPPEGPGAVRSVGGRTSPREAGGASPAELRTCTTVNPSSLKSKSQSLASRAASPCHCSGAPPSEPPPGSPARPTPATHARSLTATNTSVARSSRPRSAPRSPDASPSSRATSASRPFRATSAGDPPAAAAITACASWMRRSRRARVLSRPRRASAASSCAAACRASAASACARSASTSSCSSWSFRARSTARAAGSCPVSSTTRPCRVSFSFSSSSRPACCETRPSWASAASACFSS